MWAFIACAGRFVGRAKDDGRVDLAGGAGSAVLGPAGRCAWRHGWPPGPSARAAHPPAAVAPRAAVSVAPRLPPLGTIVPARCTRPEQSIGRYREKSGIPYSQRKNSEKSDALHLVAFRFLLPPLYSKCTAAHWPQAVHVHYSGISICVGLITPPGSIPQESN